MAAQELNVFYWEETDHLGKKRMAAMLDRKILPCKTLLQLFHPTPRRDSSQSLRFNTDLDVGLYT